MSNMQTRLLCLFLTHVPLGYLLSLSLPTWAVVLIVLLVWLSTDIEMAANNETTCAGLGGMLFLLLVMVVWMPIAFGFFLLDLFLLVNHLNQFGEGSIHYTTVIMFFLYPIPILYELLHRWFRGRETTWNWLIAIVVSYFFAGGLSLALPVSPPDLTGGIVEGLNEIVKQGWQLIAAIDLGALSATWLASVVYFVPLTRSALKRSVGDRYTPMIMLGVATTSLALGWAVPLQTLLSKLVLWTCGSLICGLGLFLLIQDWRFYQGATSTTAKISRMIETGRAYFPEFCFTDAAGKVWTVVSEVGYRLGAYRVGQNVPIFYNLNFVPVAKLHTFWLSSFIIVGMGLLIFFTAFRHMH